MIALDTSALIAIALDEAESDAFARVVAQSGAALIGTPTLVETAMVPEARPSDGAAQFLEGLMALPPLRSVDFDHRMARAARAAFLRFGRGRGHPARLNMGDCMAYAVAKVWDVPLLFKGRDFIHTDLTPAAP